MTKHPKAGIISFIISVVATVLIFPVLTVSYLVTPSSEVHSFMKNGVPLILFAIGVLLILSFPVSLYFGWAGLAQPNSKKLFSILGLVVSQLSLIEGSLLLLSGYTLKLSGYSN